MITIRTSMVLTRMRISGETRISGRTRTCEEMKTSAVIWISDHQMAAGIIILVKKGHREVGDKGWVASFKNSLGHGNKVANLRTSEGGKGDLVTRVEMEVHKWVHKEEVEVGAPEGVFKMTESLEMMADMRIWTQMTMIRSSILELIIDKMRDPKWPSRGSLQGSRE